MCVDRSSLYFTLCCVYYWCCCCCSFRDVCAHRLTHGQRIDTQQIDTSHQYLKQSVKLHYRNVIWIPKDVKLSITIEKHENQNLYYFKYWPKTHWNFSQLKHSSASIFHVMSFRWQSHLAFCNVHIRTICMKCWCDLLFVCSTNSVACILSHNLSPPPHILMEFWAATFLIEFWKTLLLQCVIPYIHNMLICIQRFQQRLKEFIRVFMENSMQLPVHTTHTAFVRLKGCKQISNKSRFISHAQKHVTFYSVNIIRRQIVYAIAYCHMNAFSNVCHSLTWCLIGSKTAKRRLINISL